MSKPFHFSTSNIVAAKARSILDRAILLLVISSFSCSLLASQFYRYKNENGQLVLSQVLPAKYAEKGYDILNEKGRIIKTIAPALTPEEIAKRDDAIEKERLALIAKQKQDEEDEELKQLYSQPNDAVRVLGRRVIDIESVIKLKRNKIKSIKSQIIEEESSAANRQRKGLPVGDDAIDKLNALKKDIENNHADINELYIELDRVVSEFDEKIKRLVIITKHESSDYPEVLEAIESLRQSKSAQE